MATYRRSPQLQRLLSELSAGQQSALNTVLYAAFSEGWGRGFEYAQGLNVPRAGERGAETEEPRVSAGVGTLLPPYSTYSPE